MDPGVEALMQAVRADERANAAHERLDRMNGSIDALRGEVAATNAKIDSTSSEILRRLDRQDGFDEGEETAERERSTRWGLVIAAAAAVGAIASAFTYALVIAFHL
jgi:hypothetical protein